MHSPTKAWPALIALIGLLACGCQSACCAADPPAQTKAISQNVTAEGVVNNTCEGTNIGPDVEFYARRGRPADDLHGRGVVMLAGTEILAGGKK